jgi:hypothetical protein
MSKNQCLEPEVTGKDTQAQSHNSPSLEERQHYALVDKITQEEADAYWSSIKNDNKLNQFRTHSQFSVYKLWKTKVEYSPDANNCLSTYVHDYNYINNNFGLSEGEYYSKCSKEQRKEERERRYKDDYRYDARTGKSTKGSVFILPDCALYPFEKIPVKQLMDWFPSGFNNFEQYEKYRRICRRLFISLYWRELFTLLDKFDFVDIRSHENKGRMKFKHFGNTVIYTQGEKISHLIEFFFPDPKEAVPMYRKQMYIEGCLSDLTSKIVDLNLNADRYSKFLRGVPYLDESTFRKQMLSAASVVIQDIKDQELVTTVSETMKTLDDTSKRTNCFLNRCNALFDDAEQFMDTVSKLFMGYKTTFDSWSNYCYDTLFHLCLVISSVIRNGYAASTEIMMSFVARFISPSSVGRLVYEIFKCFNDDDYKYEKQSADDFSGLPKIGALLTLFAVVLGIIARKGSFTVESALNVISETGKWCHSVFVLGKGALKSIVDLFESFFDDCLTFLGFSPISQIGLLKLDVQRIIDYQEQAQTTDYLNNIFAEPFKIEELEEMIRLANGVTLRLKCVNDTKLSLSVANALRWMTDWHNKFIGASAAPIGERVRPTVIMLQGNAGVGKSLIANCIADDILRLVYKCKKGSENWKAARKQLVWEYRVDPADVDAYFNGLTCQHRVMIWSEAFQRTDTPLNPVRDIATIMACVDTAGFAPPQAFASKGKIPYEIPFIIITTNLEGPVKECPMNWKSSHAINRRFDFVFDVSANPGDVEQGIPSCCVPGTHRIDPEKLLTYPDAVLFKRRTFDMQCDPTGKEMPVTCQTAQTPTPYRDVMIGILDSGKNYNKMFYLLAGQPLAQSKTVDDLEGLYEYDSSHVTKPYRKQMFKAGFDYAASWLPWSAKKPQSFREVEQPQELEEQQLAQDPVIADEDEILVIKQRLLKEYSTLELPETTSDECVVHRVALVPGPIKKSARLSLVNIAAPNFVNLIGHLKGYVQGKIKMIKLICGECFHFPEVLIWCSKGDLYMSRVNKQGFAIEVVHTSIKFFENTVESKEVIDQYADFQQLSLEMFYGHPRFVEVYDERAVKLCYLIDLMMYGSRNSNMGDNWLWASGRVEYSGSDQVVEPQQLTVMREEYKYVRSLKWLAVAVGGILGLVGISGLAYKFLKPTETKQAPTLLIQPDPVSIQQVLDEDEMESQTGKHDGKVPAARIQNVRVAPVVKIDHVAQTGKHDGKVPAARIAKIRPTQPQKTYTKQCSLAGYQEGQTVAVSADYSEFFKQALIRQDNDNHALRAKLWANTVCMYLCDDNGIPYGKRRGNMLFVTGRTAIMPRHYTEVLKKGVRFCFYGMQANQNWNGFYEECVETFYNDNTDLMSLTFPDRVSFPTIIKHFVRDDELGTFTATPAILTSIAPFVKEKAGKADIILFIKEYCATLAKPIDAPIPYEKETPVEHWNVLDFERKGYKYSIITQDGDCGSALTAINPHLPRKILGIHVCGNEGGGISVTVTQEMARALIPTNVDLQKQGFSPQVKLNYDKEIRDPYFSFYGFMQHDENEVAALFIGSTCDFKGSSRIGGRSIYNGHHTDNCLIAPSILQDPIKLAQLKKCELFAKCPTKTPAKIVDYLPNEGEKEILPAGTEPNPKVRVKYEAFKKLSAHFKWIDSEQLQECVEDSLQFLYEIEDWQNYARVLTFEEAVFGVAQGDPLDVIGSINANSSPGKVWELKKKGSKQGKNQWINLQARWFDPELKKACDAQMADWMRLKRSKDVFSGESKSELRKPPKHLVPRMYNSGDMVTLINTKRLFGGVVALMQKMWREGGITVGINPHMEFDLLMRHLQSKGLQVFDGDFEKFDGTFSATLLECVMKGLFNFYWSSNRPEFLDEYLKFARGEPNLFYAFHTSGHVIRFAVLIILGMLIYLHKGNPSGNFLTTQINSVGVKAGMRMCWQHIFKDNPQFYGLVNYNLHVVEVANGDDNIVNVSDVAAPFFNQVTVAKAMWEVMGMKYTAADKSSVLVPTKTIGEVQYLKRSLVLMPGSKTLSYKKAGALEIDSIVESVLWYKRGKNAYENFRSTISSALQEMFHHGFIPYNQFRNALLLALRGTDFGSMTLLNWREVEYLYFCNQGTSFGFAY